MSNWILETRYSITQRDIDLTKSFKEGTIFIHFDLWNHYRWKYINISNGIIRKGAARSITSAKQESAQARREVLLYGV